MSRVMYDSVNAASVPIDGNLYAGYIDGHYANVAALRARFPHKPVVTITVTGRPGANVCDCEPGDLTPQTAAQWAAREVHAGRQPTIYMNASTWPAVRRAVKSAGVAGKVSYWVAHYDGNPTIPVGAVAKQYLGDFPNGHGGTYDKSSVAAHWPGVDPVPPPAPNPTPTKEQDVRLYRITGTKPVWATNGIHRRWVQSPAELTRYKRDFGLSVIALPAHSTFLNDIPTVGTLPPVA